MIKSLEIISTKFKLIAVFLLLFSFSKQVQSQCTDGVVLDGVNEYMHTPFNNYNFSNFTMECWINVPNYTSNVHYMSLYQNSYIVLGDWANGEFSTWVNGVNPISIDATSNPSANAWHHVAFVYDGSNQIIYVDGVQVAITAATGTVTQNATTYNQGLVIGARYSTSTQFVNGMFRDVRMWEVARTQVDIQNNMNATLTGSETGLVAYYTFSDGVGSSTVTDQTGNGNTLTLYNMEVNSDWIISGLNTSSTDTVIACDSLTWIDGNTYFANNTTATHTLAGASINGCDSTVTLDLTINNSPTVTIAPFSTDTVCLSSSAVNLPVGTPALGVYSGNGVSGTSFDPNSAGTGDHYVIYSYTDGNTCTSSDSTLIVVNSCVGINESTNFHGVSIFPNPNNGIFTIEVINTDANVKVINTQGQVILTKKILNKKEQFDLSNNAKGIYFVTVTSNEGVTTQKVIVQ